MQHAPVQNMQSVNRFSVQYHTIVSPYCDTYASFPLLMFTIQSVQGRAISGLTSCVNACWFLFLLQVVPGLDEGVSQLSIGERAKVTELKNQSSAKSPSIVQRRNIGQISQQACSYHLFMIFQTAQSAAAPTATSANTIKA